MENFDQIKITPEMASQEVESWLDYKKLSSTKRETQKANIENLIDAITIGVLVIEEDKTIVHQLKFPVKNAKEEITVNELKYKPRLQVANIHAQMKDGNSSDADGRLLSYVSALTGQNKGTLRALDSEDYSIASSIAVFFI